METIGSCILVLTALVPVVLLPAQDPPRPDPAPAPIRAVTAPAAAPAASRRVPPAFLPSLLRYHAGDALPDFEVLTGDGEVASFAARRGDKVTIVVMLPTIGADERQRPQQDAVKAIARRYAADGVQTAVLGLWMARADFLAAAKTSGAEWPAAIYGDPVGPYSGPADDQDARMAHHRQTVMGKLFGGGMTPPLPSAFVVDGAGKLAGSFMLRTDVSYDGIANLLLRAGAKVAPERMPKEVVPDSFWAKAPPRPPEAPVQLAEVGATAQDFAMVDAAGKPVRLADHAGKVIVLDFWATWCGPCKAALPHVQEVAAKYKDQGVVVIASCTNDGREAFLEYVADNQARFPDVVFGFDPLERSPERASRTRYGVSGIPQQFVIGRDGKIASAVDGYMAGEVLLDAALAAAGIAVDPAVLEKAAADRKRREDLRRK